MTQIPPTRVATVLAADNYDNQDDLASFYQVISVTAGLEYEVGMWWFFGTGPGSKGRMALEYSDGAFVPGATRTVLYNTGLIDMPAVEQFYPFVGERITPATDTITIYVTIARDVNSWTFTGWHWDDVYLRRVDGGPTPTPAGSWTPTRTFTVIPSFTVTPTPTKTPCLVNYRGRPQPRLPGG